jgi:hypothetical protein
MRDYTDPTSAMLRGDFSGTIWFAGALIASALPLAGLLAAGWRPADLPAFNETLWWIGAALIAVALFGLAYAGCPVLGKPFAQELRLKNLAVQGGLVLFGLGSAVSLLAVLLAPA